MWGTQGNNSLSIYNSWILPTANLAAWRKYLKQQIVHHPPAHLSGQELDLGDSGGVFVQPCELHARSAISGAEGESRRNYTGRENRTQPWTPPAHNYLSTHLLWYTTSSQQDLKCCRALQCRTALKWTKRYNRILFLKQGSQEDILERHTEIERNRESESEWDAAVWSSKCSKIFGAMLLWVP